MFLPAIRPGELKGQTLKIKATFLGVGVVEIGGTGFAGLLFRDGEAIFLLRSENLDGDAVVLFQDIGGQAVQEVQGYRETIAGLVERLKADRATIADLRSQAEIDKAAVIVYKGLAKEAGDTVDIQAAQHRVELTFHKKRYDAAHEVCEQLQQQLEDAHATISRYVSAFGEVEVACSLDPAPYPVLDFGPPPPPFPDSATDRGTSPPREWTEANPAPVDSDLL